MDRLRTLQLRDRLRELLPPAWPRNWRTASLFTAILGLAFLGILRTRKVLSLTGRREREFVEPGLLAKHSSFASFTTTSGHVYPKIRVFYSAHYQAKKLPKDIPLLVFIHGLGGTAAQFVPLLTSLVNVAPCLAIDLPGCGQSDFKPDNPAAYTTSVFAELVSAAIEHYRDAENNQQVVLIGHSMGCSISALLASSASPLQKTLKLDCIIGMVALSPRSGPFTPREARSVKQLSYLPVPVFDLIRMWDRRGGVNSASISRLVGEFADFETRQLQQRFNE
ncbi:hypothetical protein LTR62_007503 [Meristemomyces frigidus]|uniref:AB hydrolase-1 domain-containing protein n=1 Tax=Meristemomyces frigidus TaxID=1508187 RepID=A0AAN7TMC8_9PEZI|nr:hypothetical protein LTR62_007503 [Meristemomyces frigidus]